MNKTGLIEIVATRLGGDKKAAAIAVDAFTDTVTTAVASGEKVAIIGFGSWESVERPAKDARNPATGAVIHVPATRVPKFKAGTEFKIRVKGGPR